MVWGWGETGNKAKLNTASAGAWTSLKTFLGGGGVRLEIKLNIAQLHLGLGLSLGKNREPQPRTKITRLSCFNVKTNCFILR